MERGTNLDTLREDDNEHEELDNSDSEEEEKGDGGFRRGEPNKFDSLCDGVLNTLGLVHASLQELLELKDELLQHKLPANVMSKISLTNTKVFRSMGDMHMPINELIRVVRMYSTPWEEKSTALKKLHEDYEAKKSQLNIAIKRLQLVDAQSRRMTRDKRVMNWEKLYCRVTAARGHGRRWKFLIDSFKKKAKEGIPALQRYLDDMEQLSDSEEEEEEEEDFPVDTDLQQEEQVELADTLSDQSSDTESEGSDEDLDKIPDDFILSALPDQTRKEVPVVFIKPPTKDQEVSTSDPDFERFLYIRVFTPEGLDFRELRCTLTCGKDTYKTELLDPIENEEEASDSPDIIVNKMEEMSTEPENKGSRLIGTRGSKASIDSKLSSVPEEIKEVPSKPRFDECLFCIPVHDKAILQPRFDATSVPENLRISVKHGSRQEIVAMATIEIADLENLGLHTVILPVPPGCADHLNREDRLLMMNNTGDEESERSTFKSESLDSLLETPKYKLPKYYRNITPTSFPLYAIHTGSSDSVHMPCGQLPMVCMWAKKLHVRAFHKSTESESVTEIVEDLTGINLEEVTKEDLTRERTDRAVSVMSRTPDPEQETVPRSDYDRQMRVHNEEMELLQKEYEQRLQDLADHLNEMQTIAYEQHEQLQRQQQQQPAGGQPQHSRSRSSTTLRSASSQADSHHPHPPGHPPQSATMESSNKRRTSVKTPVHWGENLPKDFFERLQWFEDINSKKKQEMSEKTQRETSEMLEKRLAGEFKLGGPMGDPEAQYNSIQDVSLPAVFMPTKGRDLTIYNPRASKYFHATGSTGLRLTQPPSMVQLPPLPQNKVNVVNMFEMSNNFQSGGNQWVIQRYLQHQQQRQQQQQLTERSRTATSIRPDDQTPSYDSPPVPHSGQGMYMSAGVVYGKEAMLE